MANEKIKEKVLPRLIGFPHFALVDGENIRIATSDETMKIMGLKR